MTPPAEVPEAPLPRGPAVSGAETLLRVVPPKAAHAWMPKGVPSSALFYKPAFSAEREHLADFAELAARWAGGNGIVAFGCQAARELGFDARDEPEPFAADSPEINLAHANVYCDLPDADRKRAARSLAATCLNSIRRYPDALPT